MNSSKREKTPWTKLRKKPGPKKKENGEYLFDESRRKELENKAYPSEFMAATTFFGGRSLLASSRNGALRDDAKNGCEGD